MARKNRRDCKQVVFRYIHLVFNEIKGMLPGATKERIRTRRDMADSEARTPTTSGESLNFAS